MLNMLEDHCLVQAGTRLGAAWFCLWVAGALTSSLALEGQAVAAGFGLVPKQLRCEYLVNPAGMDELHPRLSWVVESDQRGQRQTAYQIVVASDEAGLREDKGDLWDSGKVTGGETTDITYGGKALTSQQRCFWKLKVWDKDGKASAWSEPAVWSMALLKPGDWKAQYISFRMNERNLLFARPPVLSAAERGQTVD